MSLLKTYFGKKNHTFTCCTDMIICERKITTMHNYFLRQESFVMLFLQKPSVEGNGHEESQTNYAYMVIWKE